ncbi:MAG: MFS transporter [Desulfovibrio sp.]
MFERKHERDMYIFLFVLAVGTACAFQGWRTLLNNFAVDVASVDGLQMGIVQSIREIPGFLSLLVVYVLLILKEHRLAALSVVILGIGVSATGMFPSFVGIAFTTLLMSFGFHYFETLNQSLTLQYFGLRDAPIVMGRLRSVGAMTNIFIGGIIWFAATYLSYEVLFFFVGAVAVGAGVWGLFRDPSSEEIATQRKELVMKKKYWLFYALVFLAGARRQVFVAFAVFLLVDKFQYSVQAITLLFVVNNVINYFANPLIGKAVNRFGERKVLSLEYLALVGVFITYALTESALVAGCLYVIDNLFFNFAIATKTFYQKIAEKEDMASGMAVGFTITHIAAVVIPALGGLAWLSNYRIVFFGAAFLSLVSLLLTQFIDRQLSMKNEATCEKN